MEVKVLRRTAGIFSGRGLLKKKIKDFLNLLGGKPMEQINRKSYKISKVEQEKGIIEKFFKDIGEQSKILYNKYIRATVYHDHLEVKKIKRHTLETAMMEFIRRQ